MGGINIIINMVLLIIVILRKFLLDKDRYYLVLLIYLFYEKNDICHATEVLNECKIGLIPEV